jgi:hypothetical protein
MYAQAGILPDMMDLESYWLPKLQQHQLQSMTGQMNTMNQAYAAALPGMQKNAASFNEAMAPIMQDSARISRESYMTGLGGGADILNTMNQQAQAGLARGREIDPQELEYAQQLARAGAAGRGLGNSVQGIAGEILNTNALRTQREASNRQYAGQVFGFNQGVANSAFSTVGQPFMQNAMGVSPLQMMGLARQGMGDLGPSYLQPESGYNAQLIGMNNKMAFDASAASAAGTNGLIGAGIGAAGMII